MKENKLDLKLCSLIVSKSLPITLVDAKELRSFSNSIDIRYKLPCSQTLKSTLISKYKKDLQTFLIQVLEKLPSVNLVTDIWTDPSMRSFIAFNAQGIDDEWEIIKVNVCTKQMTGTHNNESIFITILNILNELKIGNKIFKVFQFFIQNTDFF